ncbi:MAG: ComEC/Rec2 family competence protein [Marinoscillum sp.]
MFKWSAFPFIRLSIGLSAGIILSESYAFLWQGYTAFYTYIILVLLVIASVRLIRNPALKGSVLLIGFVYLGGLLALLNHESDDPKHYSWFVNVDGFIGTITSDHTERTDYFRYQLEVNAIYQDSADYPAIGTLFLYVDKSEPVLKYGDVVSVTRSYFQIADPKNPEEFNYRKYLARQNIYAHAFLHGEDLEVIDHAPPNHLLEIAFGIRVTAQQYIALFIPNEREQAIVSALLLGIKDHLDNEVKTAYASAGAMHVLAVSGLHVGILFLLLELLFRPWKDKRYGRYVFMIVTISIIWMYALITGFSPSVVRAATMFSVVIISKSFQRRSNIYNSLGIAAFLLIILDPFVIYAVGFQLSFAAVFGIVLIHPLIYYKLTFYSKFGDYIWSITCVSIAAQIATFPLTLLYFNQFPTYFLVSNLIVIPAAFVIFFGGIFMLLGGVIWDMVGQVLGFLVQFFVSLINELMIALQYLPHPIFDWLYFDRADVVLVYGVILLFLLSISKFNFHLMKLAAFCTILLVSWAHVKTVLVSQQHKIIVYEVEGITAIDLIKGNRALLLVDQLPEGEMEVLSFQVNPYRLANGLSRVEESWQTFQESDLVYSDLNYDLITWSGQTILIPHQQSNYQMVDTINTDILLIPNTQGICEKINSDLILLGNDFNYYERQKVRRSLDTLEIPVHSLADDGYWALDLNRNNSKIGQLAALVY